MINAIYSALLRRVYYPVTAVVSLGEDGCVIGVEVFDSLFGTKEHVVAGDAQAVCVIIGHPDGCTALRKEDQRNLRRVARQAGERPLSVYIAGEDIGCIKAEEKALRAQ